MKISRTFVSFKIEIYLERDGDGYHAFCPALKGLHTCGDTKREAIKNTEQAACAYVESLIKHKEKIPISHRIQKIEYERLPPRVSRHEATFRVPLVPVAV